MYIAQKLKKENIGEYLLYMWQIEDLLRAFQLDMKQVEKHIIQPYALALEKSQTLYAWYESLIDMMRREDVQQKGHIQLNKNIMLELNELHNELLRTGIEPGYNAKFYHILPAILHLRTQQNDSSISDIEVCFNFLYGIMTLKMKKQEISPETQRAQSEISKFVVLLSQNYQGFKSGTLNFDHAE